MGKPSKAEQIAALIVSALVVWQTLPDHQRRLIQMRVLAAVQRVLAGWARSEGHAGMGDELAGRWGVAARRYAATLKLSVARDKAASLLDTMRP
jgi:hypothetical protein